MKRPNVPFRECHSDSIARAGMFELPRPVPLSPPPGAAVAGRS